METTEKIVDSWCRQVKGWFTISNIKLKGGNEIDLLAIDLKDRVFQKYHIEVSISISDSFSKLTHKEFTEESYKEKTKKPSQRRTVGFFITKKV